MTNRSSAEQTRLPPLDVWSEPRQAKDAPASCTIERRKPGAADEQNIRKAFADFLLQLCAQSEVCFYQVDRRGNLGFVTASRQAGAEETTKIIEEEDKDSERDNTKSDFVLSFACAQSNPLRRHRFLLLVESREDQSSTAYTLTCTSERASSLATIHLLNAFLLQVETDTSCRHALTADLLNSAALNHPARSVIHLLSSAENSRESPSYTLHANFIKRAHEAPNRPALSFLTAWSDGEEEASIDSLTYGELDLLSDHIAKHLLQQSLSRNSIVPIYAGPSIELYATYLACLKVGLAFSPLPIDAPAQRISDMLDDVDAEIILLRGPFPVPLSNDTPTVDLTEIVTAFLEGRSERISASCHDFPEVSPETLAYVLYTSGSTGKPKGVQITHSAAACSIASHMLHTPLPPHSRWFQFAAPTFDPSIMEIFVTLGSGHTLCSAERHLTLENVNRTVCDLKATVMMATPSMATLLVPNQIPTLKSLWTMGEALSTKLIDTFASRSVNDTTKSLINAYGPTEASINCTMLQVPRGYRGSILGLPLPTCSLYIIHPDSSSDHLCLIPAGLTGELCIGGPQLSVGYRNRAQETAAAFIDHPILGRVYRTGDRARYVWNENGEKVVEILGRINADQVKISGRRVELGEVDAVINGVDDVRQAVSVLCQPHGQTQLCLVVLIVPRSSKGQDDRTRSALQEACFKRAQQHLPPFLRPYQILITSAIPSNASGKVDRKASRALAEQMLHAATHNNMSSSAQAAESSTSASVSQEQAELESILVNSLAHSLGRSGDSIRSTTPLADLGLSSFAAMHFLQHTQKCLPSEVHAISFAHLMDSQTSARSIAKALLGQKRKKGEGDTTGSETDGICSPHLSAEQKHELETNSGLLFEKAMRVTATQAGILSSFCRSSSAGSRQKTYIHQKGYVLGNDVDVDRFCSAFSIVLRRHETFRTVFMAIDDAKSPFVQCVLPAEDQLPELDVERISCADDQSLEHKQDQTFARHASEISIDRPSIRASLLCQADGKQVLLVSMMHAIFDGGSLKLFEEDLQREYMGLSSITRQQSSFSVQRYLSSTEQFGDKTDAFWREELALSQSAAFPCISGEKKVADSTDADKSCFTVERVSQICTLPSLEEAAQEAGVSALSFAQLAWALLVGAVSETPADSVVFGSVVSNRLDSESQNCMAPTFTTVPVCVRMSGQSDCTLKDALDHLAARARASLSHTYPALGTIKTESGTLPYDTLLALQVFPGGQQEEATLWDGAFYPPMHNDFAVMLEIWPTETGPLRLKVTCKHSISNEESAAVLLAELDHLLAGMVKSDLNVQVGKLYSSSMPSSLLSVLGRPDRFEESTLLLHEHFEQHVELSPDSPALAFSTKDPLSKNAWQTKELTYAQLDERAEAFANILVQANGGCLLNEPVPLCVPQSIELYIAILGILKAGGAWCPIDPAFPLQRQRRLIERTGARLLVLQEGFTEGDAMIENLGISIVFVQEKPTTTAIPLLNLTTPRRPSPSDLAYLIWTSGSTGEPKGVLIEHHAASTAMKALQEVIPADSPPRTLQFSAFTFDIHIQDLFYTWGLGGCVISATRESMIDDMPGIVEANRATHAHLTPAFGATVSRASCPSLKVVTMIGEKLTESVASDWSKDVLFFNTYGPAENTVVSTYRRIGDVEEQTTKASNVGWPLPSVSLAVMKNGVPVPRGGVGELALGGPHLARGYLQDEAKTQKQFFFSAALGERVYMTGDMVRMLPDGSLDFLGRTDDMIKINGVRIELSEISRTLMGCHTLIKNIETLYLSRPDQPQKVLICFLCVPGIMEEGGANWTAKRDLQEEAVRCARERAQERLPIYMRPLRYLLVEEVPRSASAKVDTKKLAAVYSAASLEEVEIEGTRTDDADEDVTPTLDGPSTIVAESIAEILALPLSSVVRSKSLPSLGLDSIRCIRLSAALKKQQIHASAFDLMQAQTLEDICRKISSAQKKKVTSRDQEQYLCDFNDRHIEKCSARLDGHLLEYVAPVSPLQESLLLETSVHYEAYWSSHLFLLHEDVDLSRLQEAWSQVAQDTEILRATFLPMAEVDENGEGFMQCVYRQVSIEWNESCVGTGESSEEAVLASVRRASQARASSWSGQLGWSITVLHHEAATPMRSLVLVIHHALYDKIALDHLFHQVRQAHSGESRLRYTQLSTALKMGLTPSKAQQEATNRYWRDLLTFQSEPCQIWSLPELSGLPTDREEKETLKMNTVRLQLSVDKYTMSAYARKLEANSCAPLVLAAFGAVLAEYLAQDSILVGTTLSERSFHPELDNAIAPLIASIPVLVNRASGTSRQLLQDVARQWRQSPEHRHVSGNTIRKALSWPSDKPLYPAFFVFHPKESGKTRTTLQSISQDDPIWTTKEKEGDSGSIKVDHDIALNLHDTSNGRMTAILSVSSSVMSLRHVEIFSKQIDAQLSVMLQHQESPLAELSARMPSDLLSISAPHSTITPTHPYHWVETHARQHSNWLAVEEVQQDFTAKSWTYRQLDRRVCQYARLLRATLSSTVAEPVIAVCMGRTLESFAAILAIFRIDGVYLPIAEDLPRERKKFLIADSNASVILASDGLTQGFEGLHETELLATDSPEIRSMLDAADGDLDDTCAPATGEGGYLLYTSGSTGTPKGVRVTNQNLSCFIEGYASLMLRHSTQTGQLGGRGKQLNLASRAFDPHLSQMFIPWRLGFCATTGPRMLLLEDLGRTINTLGITHMGILPSMLDQSGLSPRDVPSLTVLGVGGEKMSRHVVDTWAAGSDSLSSPPVTIFNLYGPTETTIGCTVSVVTGQSSPKNIGFPIGNSSALVVEPGTLRVVKLGQKGELCIAGGLVAKGYLRDVSLSGFCRLADGTPAYRTGDVVQMMSDRSLEFLGRNDEQIKIRGQRLELSEVTECVLSASVSPPIQAAATAYFKHPKQPTARLFTFFSCSKAHRDDRASSSTQHRAATEFLPGGSHLCQQIAGHCEKQLPSFMVPWLIEATVLPLLPSGKMDVKRIVRDFCACNYFDTMAGASIALSNTTTASGRNLTEREKQIAETVKQVLGGGDRISDASVQPYTSIFELGIDSLNAVNLSFRLRKLGFQASVASLMSADTLSQIAQLPRLGGGEIQKEEEKSASFFDLDKFDKENMDYLSGASTGRQLALEEVEEILPALPLQQGLVAMSIGQSWQGDSSLYVHHAAFQLNVEDTEGRRSLSADCLTEAWRKVAAREQILRTCFAEGCSGEIVQVVYREGSRPELIAMKQGNTDGAPQSWRDDHDAISRSITDDINTVPPYRVVILDDQSQDKQPMMLVSMHHSLYDAESFDMLLDDMMRFALGEAPALRPQPKPFVALVANQDLDDARRFWTEYLKDFQPVKIIDEEDIGKPSGATIRHSFAITDASFEALKKRAVRCRVTLSVLCQTVFALIIARRVQRSDVVIGNVMSGRHLTLEGIEDMMIPTLTTVPLRLNLLHSSKTVDDAIQAAKESSASVWEYQHTSLAKIQRWAECEQALFDCLFSFRLVQSKTRNDDDDDDDAVEGKSASFHQIDSSHSTGYPLALEIGVDEGRQTLQATLACCGPGLDADVVSALGEQLELLFAQIGGQKDSIPLSMFGLGSTGITDDSASRRSATSIMYDEEAWEPEERQIQRILGDSLHRQVQGGDDIRIAKNTSFYALGLDSILAIRFTRLLREEGLKTNTGEILQARCIGGLWQAIKKREAPASIEEELGEEDETDSILMQRHAHLFQRLGDGDSLEAIYRCTPLQCGMLSQSIVQKESSYDQKHKIRLRDGIDVKRVKRAWAKVVQRHDILRTTFHLTDETAHPWIAVVHSNPPVRWQEGSFCSQDDEAGFDVPPLRVEAKGNSLAFHIHHSLYDGNSLPMIFDSLREVYQEHETDAKGTLAPPFHRAATYIVQQQERSDQFWTDITSGYEYAALPMMLNSAEEMPRPSRWRSTRSLASDTSHLELKCRQYGVSLQSVSLLAFAKVLGSLLQRRDICFGQVISGRSLPIRGVSELVGPLFNTIPFRVTLDSIMESNVEAVRKVQALSEKSHLHQSCSLRSVQSNWRREQGGRAPRLFDCLFLFQRKSRLSASQGVALWDSLNSDEDSHTDEEDGKDDEYDLNFNITSTADAVKVSINGTSRIFTKKSQLDKTLEEFEAIVTDILDSSQRPVLSFPEALSKMPLRSKAAASRVAVAVAADLVRPCQGNEVILQEKLCKMLGIVQSTINASTNLFVAGVDSISAIRLSQACRQRGVNVSAASILQGQTVEEICRLGLQNERRKDSSISKMDAKILVSEQDKRKALEILKLEEDEVQDVMPCLAGQLHHLDAWHASGHRFYEAPWVYKARDGEVLDGDKLLSAWKRLCHKNETLRTTFVCLDGNALLQVILKADAYIAPWLHRSVVEKCSSLEEVTTEYVVESNVSPSNLFSPPVRLCLLQKEGEGCSLVLRLHHALYDAHSIGQLVGDLEKLYQGADLPPRPSFSSFVRHVASQEDETLQETRWKRSLNGSQTTLMRPSLSLDTPHRQEEIAHGPQLLVRLPHVLPNVDRLKQKCREEGVTLQHVVMLAFAKTIAERTSPSPTKTPVFGFYSSNRSSDFPNIDALLGPTLNVLPVAIPLGAGDSVRTTVQDLNDELRSRVGFEQTSLKRIVKWVNNGAEGGAPLFNCYLNLLWHHQRPSESTLNPSDNAVSSQKRLFQPWKLTRDTGYFTRQAAQNSVRTTLGSRFNTDYLAKNGFYVDVGLKDDSFHLGIRCSALEHSEEFVQKFAQDFAQKIEETVSRL